MGPVVHVCAARSGVADKGRNLGGESGGAQTEAAQQLLGEVEFVVGELFGQNRMSLSGEACGEQNGVVVARHVEGFQRYVDQVFE
ncbi:hypothetical protein QF035_010331 [Streptomyces umbrinus]|uniref:Uncharacterized protein n=1 Tax=Streptomyces umbrinus TaxID=67370 RepID=A0ABU0TAA7_9ACTN|nr:hypothetical protein [Streptomyces umbrinus]MDQ1032749.1 hypothetical protein [Streptomyces umbrinus]